MARSKNVLSIAVNGGKKRTKAKKHRGKWLIGFRSNSSAFRFRLAPASSNEMTTPVVNRELAGSRKTEEAKLTGTIGAQTQRDFLPIPGLSATGNHPQTGRKQWAYASEGRGAQVGNN